MLLLLKRIVLVCMLLPLSPDQNMVDLMLHSRWLRRDILHRSGGWLGEVVAVISNALGIWDIFILAILIFIPAWIILRISSSLASMELGFVFDATIPLQHQMNPHKKLQHAQHLAGYWPIFGIVTGIEAVCFFVLHPDLFTLVVCLKTTVMTALWLSKRGDDFFMTEKISHPPKIPSLSQSSEITKATSPSVSQPNPTMQGTTSQPTEQSVVPTTHNQTTSSSKPTKTPESSKPTKTPESSKPTETPEQRWERKLKAAGYDDPEGLEGMIKHLKSLEDPKKEETCLKQWVKDKDPANKKKRMERYKTKASQNELPTKTKTATSKDYRGNLADISERARPPPRSMLAPG